MREITPFSLWYYSQVFTKRNFNLTNQKMLWNTRQNVELKNWTFFFFLFFSFLNSISFWNVQCALCSNIQTLLADGRRSLCWKCETNHRQCRRWNSQQQKLSMRERLAVSCRSLLLFSVSFFVVFASHLYMYTRVSARTLKWRHTGGRVNLNEKDQRRWTNSLSRTER